MRSYCYMKIKYFTLKENKIVLTTIFLITFLTTIFLIMKFKYLQVL